jgi:ABC-2 type transport system permease protein
MVLHNVTTIARREYLTRIRTKGFWITTILLPLLMFAWTVIPSYIAAKSQTGQNLAVVDPTGGRIGEVLRQRLSSKEIDLPGHKGFEVEVLKPGDDPQAQRAELDEQVLAEKIDAWIWIDDAGLAANKIEYHAENVSNILTQKIIESALSRAVREYRLSNAGYDSEEVSRLTRSVDLNPIPLSETGAQKGGPLGGFALAFGLFFVLYMVILIYGQQVLQGVLEEKSSRIVEVMLSSTRPVELMAGKLVGVCGMGLTQLAIWMGTALALTTPAVVAAMPFLSEETQLPTLPISLVVHFFFMFLMGYFMFASLYAMVGAAFNDLQEAQQLVMVVSLLVVAPMFFLFAIINDPSSPLAVVTSLIPPLTPVLMILRIALKTPPWWQIALAYVLGFGFTAVVLWAAARVYRVGILMYGKRPTIPEIWRWARYSGR